MSIVREPIRPKDIAICLAIPTDLSSFSHYLAKPPDMGDYLRGFIRHDGESLDAFYARCFAADAEKLKHFVDLMHELGVSVHTDATLSTISTAFTSSKVLVFAGHWKGFSFRYWDFVDAPARIFDALEASADPMMVALTRIIKKDNANLRTSMERAAGGGIAPLRSALNAAVTLLGKTEPVARGELDALVQQSPGALRERIDQTLGSAVLPGNRFEMHDCFVDAYAFARALPDLREGILDCVVCKSDHPAPAIRRVRKLIQPITAENDKHPAAWPFLIEATIRILSQAPMPYWDARKLAREMISEIAKEKI